jgi:hypothetical protein
MQKSKIRSSCPDSPRLYKDNAYMYWLQSLYTPRSTRKSSLLAHLLSPPASQLLKLLSACPYQAPSARQAARASPKNEKKKKMQGQQQACSGDVKKGSWARARAGESRQMRTYRKGRERTRTRLVARRICENPGPSVFSPRKLFREAITDGVRSKERTPLPSAASSPSSRRRE